jgi:crotonobetainyl-CoA:carnitine CoA-transferase CaiB-like acyl-CoA transferase
MSVGAGDPLAGLQLAAMALLALEAREQTGGRGQFAEGSMIEADICYIGDEITLAAYTGRDTPRNGNRDRVMVPHAVLPCRGEDCWVALAVRDDSDWQRLLTLPGIAETGLDHERFASAAGRRAAEDEVEARLALWTASRTPDQAMFELQAAGVPAGAVHRYTEVLNDQHLNARDWFLRLSHADLGTHRYNGFAWRFRRTPCIAHHPPPRLGEHSVEVLSSLVGLTPDQIRSMMEAGITGTLLYAEERRGE